MKTTATLIEQVRLKSTVMERAWPLVDPSAGGTRAGRSWKDAIDVKMPRAEWDQRLQEATVTAADVLDCIRWFTASEPEMTEHGGFVFIKAAGFFASPAGRTPASAF